jgi:hypothetical protein
MGNSALAASAPEDEVMDLFLENEVLGPLVIPGELIIAETLGHEMPQESHNDLPAVPETAHVDDSPS